MPGVSNYKRGLKVDFKVPHIISFQNLHRMFCCTLFFLSFLIRTSLAAYGPMHMMYVDPTHHVLNLPQERRGAAAARNLLTPYSLITSSNMSLLLYSSAARLLQ